jgi:hypothetical protein
LFKLLPERMAGFPLPVSPGSGKDYIFSALSGSAVEKEA